MNVDIQPMDVDIPDDFDTPDIPLSPRAGPSTVPHILASMLHLVVRCRKDGGNRLSLLPSWHLAYMAKPPE